MMARLKHPLIVLGLTVAVVCPAARAADVTTLAGAAGGEVWGWGNIRDGIPNGGVADGTGTAKPARITVLGPSTTFTQVAIGVNHALALSSTGVVWGWGYAPAGGLGPRTCPSDTCRAEPITGLPTGHPITAIAAEGNASFMVTDTGAVYALGLNDSGQLGVGDRAPHSGPTPVVGLPTGDPVVSVVSSAFPTAYALTRSGALYSWGRNDTGQTGTGLHRDVVDRATPVAGPLRGARVTTVGAGAWGALAAASGGVYTWGRNDHGQLGDGTTTDRAIPRRVPGLPTGTVQSLTGTRDAALAVVDGRAYGWGSNSVLVQPGDDDVLHPVAIGGIDPSTVITSISGESSSVLAVLAGDQGLLGWGSNDFWQLGVPNYRAGATPVRTRIPAGRHVIDAVVGLNSNALAVLSP